MISEDQLYVQKIVKKSGTSFFWGMKTLTNEKKRAMFAVYAFCREIDDIADDIYFSKKVKLEKLLIWEKKIYNLFSKKGSNCSLSKELFSAIKKYDLSKIDFLSLIHGMRMDIKENIQFPSKKKLELYCDRVAVAVGYISIKIFGLKSQNARKYAFFLGRAFQLTNIIRDFGEDIEINRCYISTNYLKKFDIKKNLKKLEYHPNLQDVFQLVLKDANKLFNEAEILSKKLDKNKIIASEIMKSFYKAIHSKMYRKKINYKKKIKLNFLDKIFILIFFLRRRYFK